MSDKSDSMVAFLTGVIVGGVAGLLLAPASGEETRRRLAQAAGQGGDRLRDALDGARDSASTHSSAGREALAAAREAYLRKLEEAQGLVPLAAPPAPAADGAAKPKEGNAA